MVSWPGDSSKPSCSRDPEKMEKRKAEFRRCKRRLTSIAKSTCVGAGVCLLVEGRRERMGAARRARDVRMTPDGTEMTPGGTERDP